jgi:CRP-like cAMP-binding protein
VFWSCCGLAPQVMLSTVLRAAACAFALGMFGAACALWNWSQVVIAEGEPGSDFFIIESGTARANKAGVDGEVSRRLTTGDYFGERALLTNEVAPAMRCAGAVG